MLRREFLTSTLILAVPFRLRAGTVHQITPEQSLSYVSNLPLQPGDRVEFQRGGHWLGELKPRRSGEFGAPITFSAFGSGPLPIIENQNLNLGTATVYNQSYLDFDHLDVRGGKWAFNIACWEAPNDYINISDCLIGRGTRQAGVWCFCWNTQHINHGSVRRCVIDSHNHTKYTYPGEHLEDPDFQFSNGIALAEGCSNWKVSENEIRDWYHNSISIGSSSTDRPSSYNQVYSNLMTSPETSYCRAFSALGPEGACQFNDIRDNTVVETTVRSQIGGDHNRILGNTIDGVTDSPMVSQNTAQGILLAPIPTNLGWVCHHNEVSQNVITNVGDVGLELDERVGVGTYRDNIFNQDRIRYRARMDGNQPREDPISVSKFNKRSNGVDLIEGNIGPTCKGR